MDEDGVLGVITTTTDCDKIVHCTIGQLLPYVERDPNVIRYMRDSIERVLLISKNETLNDCLSQSLLRLPSPG